MALIGVSVDQVARGNGLVRSAANGMDSLVRSIRELTSVVGQITIATREQSSGVAQASQAIAEIDRVTQQNSIFVAATSAKAITLSEQAQQLVRAVARFSLEQRRTSHASPKEPRVEHALGEARKARQRGVAGRPGVHRSST